MLRKYPDPDDEMGYFKLKRNLKQLRRYYEVFDKGSVSEVYNIKILMDAYAKELKEKRSDLSENAPFYGSVGAVLAGLIGTSIYLNFYDYVAAGGIGLATSGLICGTLGALHDHINARGHDNVYPMSIFGSLGGAIAGPISYALFNFWENTGNVDWFNGIQGFPDLLAKSMLGGVAATIALLALIAAANSKN
ncbi:MAG: hypothetical protein QW666_03755 [Candidatus Woesearchaeota archaeon]